MNSQRIIIAFAIIAVLVLGLYSLFLFLAPSKLVTVKQAAEQVKPSQPGKSVSPAVKQRPATSTRAIAPQIKAAPRGELPQNFPKSLPLYGQEKIQESYEADYAGAAAGQAARQVSVVFFSDKSMKDNYDYYTKWSADNGWQIANKTETETLKFIYLKKGGEDVNITIMPAAAKTKAKVSLSYVKY